MRRPSWSRIDGILVYVLFVMLSQSGTLLNDPDGAHIFSLIVDLWIFRRVTDFLEDRSFTCVGPTDHDEDPEPSEISPIWIVSAETAGTSTPNTAEHRSFALEAISCTC